MDAYQNARREWDERYGSYIRRIGQWRVVALLSLAVAICALIFATYSHQSPKVEGFAVEYCAKDGEYYVRKLAPFKMDEAKIKASLAGWIENLRTISIDPAIIKKNVTRAYSMIAEGSQAHKRITETLQKNDPFARSKTETVEVEIKSILRQSDKSFQIDWVEINRDRKTGKVSSKRNMRGAVSFDISSQVASSEILRNPTGIRIGGFEWTSLF